VIFIDTGFIFALFAEDDANHARALAVMEDFAGATSTTLS
jgi:predicted nucleic acid-binding protein